MRFRKKIGKDCLRLHVKQAISENGGDQQRDAQGYPGIPYRNSRDLVT
jgi:hypothetical protein